MKKSLFLLTALVCFCAYSVQASAPGKTRMVVLTDMEADPDDSQTMIRLLLYSNDIDLEGLIATTSTHQRARVAPETIHKLVAAYEKVHPNLLLHSDEYPTADFLYSLIKQGPAVYGMEGVGQGKDSEGSEWLIKALEKDDERPLWVSVWGGPNVLAQALWKIKETKSTREAQGLISKLRVYTIADQDDSASWIRKTFPDLFYIVSPGSYMAATWRAMNARYDGANNEVISNPWVEKNIQQGHGPLGELYPDTAYSMEGDTPSWLGIIPNGLNYSERPDWGGWGGRYELYTPEHNPDDRMAGEPETRPIWTNADDTFTPFYENEHGRYYGYSPESYTGNHVTLWRWREDFQNDFAARMDWCTMSYEEANHAPVANVNGPLEFTVKSGDSFSLDADGSYDPDGDNLSYLWTPYYEAGTYKGDPIRIGLSWNLYNVHTIVAPEVDKPETIHFILRVADKGTPKMVSYQRVIVTVVPK